MAVASGLIAGAAGAAGAQAQTIAVHAAGSLRAPLTQAAQAFADELVGGAGQRALRQAGFLAP